jgi:Transcriptional regulator, AbiEi antitoxin
VGDKRVHSERRIARLAATQDGLASRGQLRSLGLSAKSTDHRVAIGRYIVIFRGVYAIGHAAISPRGWGRAALLAVGGDAVLSHRTAAYLWGLTNPPPTVHLTVRRKLKPRPGLTPHTADLARGEVRRRQLTEQPLLVAARLAQVLAVRPPQAVPG